MDRRLDYAKVAPEVSRAMSGLQRAVNQSGLEGPLLEMVKIRSSQINGCAFCLDMHWKDALAAGEDVQRLYMLDAWREAPCYSERERAALAWTEAVTLVAATHIPDDVYELARKSFSEQELVNLTLAIITINGWNRLAIGFRTPAGTYQPRQSAE